MSPRLAHTYFAEISAESALPFVLDDLVHMVRLRQHGHVVIGDIAVRCYKNTSHNPSSASTRGLLRPTTAAGVGCAGDCDARQRQRSPAWSTLDAVSTPFRRRAGRATGTVN